MKRANAKGPRARYPCRLSQGISWASERDATTRIGRASLRSGAHHLANGQINAELTVNIDLEGTLNRAFYTTTRVCPSARPIKRRTRAQHNTRPTTHWDWMSRAWRGGRISGRAIAYFASSTNPGRGADVFVISTLLLRGREKYAAPKTFCAITTIFLLWLISRRGKFGQARVIPVTVGSRMLYRLKLLRNVLPDDATDAIQRQNSRRCVFASKFR